MGHSVDHLSPAPPAAFSDLDGSNGFAIHGQSPYEFFGFSVGGGGDINGDGLDDLMISAPLADPIGVTDAGAGYVIFGQAAGFTPVFDQTTLDGRNGFRINETIGSYGLGVSIANAGDIDGDGFADLIIGEPEADPGGKLEAGSSYVIRGSDQGWLPSVNLTTLDGTNGFRMDGAVAGDYSGYDVSTAGDVNGDGFDDMFVGALPIDPAPALNYFVVFGSGQGFTPSFDLTSIDGSNGFRLIGSGWENSMSDAGDINGDGFDDIIATGSTTVCKDFYFCTTENFAGVVFGAKEGFPANLDLSTLNGSNGFKITNSVGTYFSPWVSGIGDFNGDGIADLAIGDSAQNGINGFSVGHVYVVYGTTQGFPAEFDVATLDGINGYRIEGAANDFLGETLGGIGDINSDGFDDLIIAQHGAAFNDRMYVVYGNNEASLPIVDISTLGGSEAFQIAVDRIIDGDIFAEFSKAGDVNGDGFGDFITGSIAGSPGGIDTAGKASAVFGNDFTASVTHAGGSGSDTLLGTGGGDVMVGGLGYDVLIGRGGADVLKGGAGHDALIVSDPGFRRVDGGSGKDALVVNGFDLDLTATPDMRIENIEVIAMSGITANQVTLAVRDLRTMSDTSNTITIVGGNGDKVVIDFTGTGFRPTDLGNGFIEYSEQTVNNGLTLLVQDSLDLSGIIF